VPCIVTHCGPDLIVLGAQCVPGREVCHDRHLMPVSSVMCDDLGFSQ
jgi:hypothetical protein